MRFKKSTARALSPEYTLLGFLTQEAAHGYELHQRLVRDLGQVWHVSLSQTYNILNRLEAKGFIKGTLQEQAKLPARRRFRLTPTGRRRFDTWLHSLTGSSVHAIRVEFTTRLYFAHAFNPEVARNLIEAQLVETRAGQARLQNVLIELPHEQTFNRLGLELRVRQLTSILDWLTHCQKELGLDK